MNIEALLRPNVRNIKAYSSARDEYKDASANMIYVDANENPYSSDVNRYPDPQQNAVKEKLAKIKGVSKDQMLLGNGSDEVLDLIFRAFCEPQIDNVITLPPTYGMYAVLADLNAVETIKIELNSQFQPKTEEVLSKQNSSSKLLLLCSPNNPTANSFDAKIIERLIRGFNGVVVIDEAYIDFSTRESWVNRLEEFPNLVVTQTLSKAYGLAGIRLGLCFASEFIISVLNRIKPPYNINQLTQKRALARLDEIKKINGEVRSIIQQREVLSEALKRIEFVREVFASDANFILVKVDDADQRYHQLISKGIVVRNRTRQPLCCNCLRFTVGTQAENEALITALKDLH